MLYEKRTPSVLSTAIPTATRQPTAETLDVANESLVALHAFYTANGSGKVLRLYPEVQIPLGGDDPWVPALSASLNVAATVDAEGYLPLPGASPILEVAGIDGVEVLLTLHIPVPTGTRFRLQFMEDGYSGGAPADMTLVAAASRGAA